MHLPVTAASTALFSSWYFIEPLGLLFDAGDGVAASLLHKSRKVKAVFLSHADRDHLAGLWLVLRRAVQESGKGPTVYYPKHSTSIPRLLNFWKKTDTKLAIVRGVGLEADEEVQPAPGIFVRGYANRHIRAEPGTTRSLSFLVEEERQKLRPAFSALSGEDIRAKRAELGDAAVLRPVRTPRAIPAIRPSSRTRGGLRCRF